MQDMQKLISSHSALMLNFSNQNDILRNITAYHSCNRLEIFVEKLQNFLLSIFHWIFYTELFLSRQDFFIIVISHWGEFYLMFFFTIFLQVKIFLKGAEWSRQALWRQAIFHGNFPWIFARFFTFFSRIFSVSFLTGLFLFLHQWISVRHKWRVFMLFHLAKERNKKSELRRNSRNVEPLNVCNKFIRQFVIKVPKSFYECNHRHRNI